MSRGGVRSAGRVGEGQLTILILGLCPAVVVTGRVVDALFMSAGVVLVLAAASMLLPLARRLGAQEPPRRPASPLPPVGPRILWGALLFTSCMAAAFELALNTVAPAVAARLGIYVPLLSVSFLVTGRLRELAESPSARSAALHVIQSGAVLSAILVGVALVREILGAGTLTLGATVVIRPLFDDPARAVGMAGGALLCLGYAAGAVRLVGGRAGKDAGEEGSP